MVLAVYSYQVAATRRDSGTRARPLYIAWRRCCLDDPILYQGPDFLSMTRFRFNDTISFQWHEFLSMTRFSINDSAVMAIWRWWSPAPLYDLGYVCLAVPWSAPRRDSFSICLCGCCLWCDYWWWVVSPKMACFTCCFVSRGRPSLCVCWWCEG